MEGLSLSRSFPRPSLSLWARLGPSVSDVEAELSFLPLAKYLSTAAPMDDDAVFTGLLLSCPAVLASPSSSEDEDEEEEEEDEDDEELSLSLSLLLSLLLLLLLSLFFSGCFALSSRGSFLGGLFTVSRPSSLPNLLSRSAGLETSLLPSADDLKFSSLLLLFPS